MTFVNGINTIPDALAAAQSAITACTATDPQEFLSQLRVAQGYLDQAGLIAFGQIPYRKPERFTLSLDSLGLIPEIKRRF